MKNKFNLSSRLTTLVVVFSICSVSWSQIIGIGEFKIGMEKEDFLSTNTLKELEVLERNSGTMNYIKSKNNYILHATVNSDLVAEDKIYSSDIEKFKFITPSFSEKQLKSNYDGDTTLAVFYKNKLAQIKLSSAKDVSLEILVEKYGKPKFKNYDEKVVCQNIFGAVTNKTNVVRMFTWDKDKRITATYYAYTGGCENLSFSTYEIVDNFSSIQIDKIQKIGAIAAEKDLLKSKISESKL